MRSILPFLLVISTPALAGNWHSLLSQGWTPPRSHFVYGYSEFTPAYAMGTQAYSGHLEPAATQIKSEAFQEFVGQGTFRIGVYEETRHVRPGLEYLGTHWLRDVKQLVEGERAGGDKLRGLPALVLENNPYWPEDLPLRKNRPIVSLSPIVMSRTMEDLGRTHPWTVYGGSEQDWETVFFKHSLGTQGTRLFCRILNDAFSRRGCDLKALGLRILTQRPELVPAELKELVIVRATRPEAIKFLVTFLPYGQWPQALRAAYKSGGLDAIPHPATLVFAGSPFYNRLSKEGAQIPLAQEFSQYAAGLAKGRFYGLRALDVSRKKQRFMKDEAPKTAAIGSRVIGDAIWSPESPFATIFEAIPTVMGIYGKPTARNTQIWGVSGPLKGQWLLDGPVAYRPGIDLARARIVADAGQSRLHFRNYFPVMQVNGFDGRWYRPLVAWTKGDEVEVDTSLLGSVRFDKGTQEEWFPGELFDRDHESALVGLVDKQGNPETTAQNARKLLEFSRLLGDKLPVDLASALLNPADEDSYAQWRAKLPETAAKAVDRIVAPGSRTAPIRPATFHSTVTSDFERSYWNRLVELTEGPLPLVNKNNTDCASTDDDPGSRDPHCDKNNLPHVVDYLRKYYADLGLKSYVQEFDWKIDFNIPWWEGLKIKQQNLIVVIHGKDGRPHDEAVIMGDHYDTAQMGDIYEGEIYRENKKDKSLVGHRHASKGADDNHSATVTLMEAAKALKDLPLKKDIWLVHITGEEFPADGLGTRALVQALVENQPIVAGRPNPKISGVYVLDMVGHSTDRDHHGIKAPSVFQIAPGRGERAARLARTAHRVTNAWNTLQTSEKWNERLGRTKPWTRYKIPKGVAPESFPAPVLPQFTKFRGEIRPGWHFRSSLYQTDIQLFADAGFPAVLFMENYDVGRLGYHDTLDTIEFIDLDYARGMATIAIETVAQSAME